MIYLLLVVLCGSMVSVVMRLSGGKVKSRMGMISANYLTCMIAAWGWMRFGTLLPNEEGMFRVLGMGTWNGFFYMMALIMNQYNISRNGVVLSSVFSKVGALLLPLLLSVIAFRETPTSFQFVGFLLAVFAIVLLNVRKGENDTDGIGKLALLGLLLTEGCAAIMSKVFSELGNPVLALHFLFYTFLTAFLFSMIVMLFRKERIGTMECLYGILIGLPNFLASRFILKALETIPAVVVYPSRSVATIVVITWIGVVVFKERLERRQFIAMGIICVALVLLNL